MRPEAGDVWRWFGEKSFLLLSPNPKKRENPYEGWWESWQALNLTRGSVETILFDDGMIRDKSWERVA
jgi:hypothetical protein